MSEDLETTKAMYAAFERGDIPGLVASADSAIEWWEPEDLPHGGTRSGRDEVLRFFSEDFPPHHEEFRSEPEEFIDAGDQVVVIGHNHGRARGGAISATLTACTAGTSATAGPSAIRTSPTRPARLTAAMAV